MNLKRAVCLNCIDGRIQLPVIEWIYKNYPVDYVDMITEPGMDGLLAGADNSIEEIKRKVNLSIVNNKAEIMFIVGHYDCRGNPEVDADHKKHIGMAVERVKLEFKKLEVIGLWVNDAWAVERI